MPYPIFSKIREGTLQIASQFVSDGLAKALASLLKVAGELGTKITELNFDDNGLRDESFCHILMSALNLPDLTSLSYNNN